MQTLTPRVQQLVEESEKYAAVIGYLMTPVAAAGYALAAWRLGADLNWVREFFISQGLLSRWQVWLALAVATHMTANQFSRIGKSGKTAAS